MSDFHQTRRAFLKCASAGAASLVFSGYPNVAGLIAAQSRKDRPNILFCLADDWSWPYASIAGDKVVKTPTFDRVARQGVLFTNAFVTAPSCTPSRGSILTGQWHWRLEEGGNLWGTLPAKFPVYPDLLEKAGYHVGYTRKGWGPGQVEPGGRTRNPAGPQYKTFEAFLKDRPKGKPFCFWFGSTDPHRPYKWRSGVDSGMNPQDVQVPVCLPDCETVRIDLCDCYWEIQRFDSEAGDLLKILEENGELDNTLVVMSGDNGMPFPRGKSNLYDSGTNVPLAVRWPERVNGSRVVEDFISLSDLAPTFLEAA
ncbi:MAG: sulfatase, partial [Sedimentisphaerales bacterium]|nr:sulfatase [Sedimentisphaerales bacterium]